VNKAVAVALLFATVAQPALACGGGDYRSHMAHVQHAPKAPPKPAVAAQTTSAPSAIATNAATMAPAAECKKHFPSIGALLAVPCNG
jgi:hypothetical protein